MSFGEDFLKGFFGSDYLKDYRHASKTFRSNSYELAPRYKFLFHTFLNVNTQEIPGLASVFPNNDKQFLGLLCKSVDLPRYEMDVETNNQYNRKRLTQHKINYLPITMTFHDDGGDTIRNLWYNYFAYYYKDPSQQYRNPATVSGSLGPDQIGQSSNRFSYNARDQYASDRIRNDWGYVGESYTDATGNTVDGSNGKPAFFRDITIFGFNQHKFAAYVLINPMIVGWDHDTYDYDQSNGLMEHKVTIAYETVKYYGGALGTSPGSIAPGFDSTQYYDQVASALARPGSTSSILGQGGLIDAIGNIVYDLTNPSGRGIIGAVQTAGTLYETFKDKNLKDTIKEEGYDILLGTLQQGITGALSPTQNSDNNFTYYKPEEQTDPTVGTPNTPTEADPAGPVGPVTTRLPGQVQEL
jgi:hypothetical protein